MSRRVLHQRGSTVVEFAFVLVILIALIFGAISFGRAVFMMNSAADATRRGARTAAIVSPVFQDAASRAAILASMNLGVYGLPEDSVTIEYSADGITFAPTGACTGRGTCTFVRVSMALTYGPVVAYVPPIQFPAISTTLPVEALGAT